MTFLPAQAAEAAFAQPFTEELLGAAQITPGMRVLVLGRGLIDLALLVAERVGTRGTAVGLSEHSDVVTEARERAFKEGFEQVEFLEGRLEQLGLGARVDAVIGRFFLTHQRDPVNATRLAAQAVRQGGRVIFQEWHYDSIQWPETADWPRIELYRQFARWSIEAMRRRESQVDIGLRLANIFAEAGLELPALRTDLRIVHGRGSPGYAFFETTLRELLPTIEECGLATRRSVRVDTFAQRLERETTAARGHLFLPLQVGAFTQV
jgi:SAM-dependent methyltransferase